MKCEAFKAQLKRIRINNIYLYTGYFRLFLDFFNLNTKRI